MFKRIMIGLVAVGLVAIFIAEAANAATVRRRRSIENLHDCSGSGDPCNGAIEVTDRIFGLEILTSFTDKTTCEGNGKYWSEIRGKCYGPSCIMNGLLLCGETNLCKTFPAEPLSLDQPSFTSNSAFDSLGIAIGYTFLDEVLGIGYCIDRGYDEYFGYKPDAIVARSDYSILGGGEYKLLEVCPDYDLGTGIYNCEIWAEYDDVDNILFPCCGEENLLTVEIQQNNEGSDEVLPPGVVTSDDGGISCETNCNETYGSVDPPSDGCPVVTLTANQEVDGWGFTGWEGGGCYGAGECTTRAKGNPTVTAVYTITKHLLTVDPDGNGTVISDPGNIECPDECSYLYTWNTDVTLTAIPADGYIFNGWTGGGCDGTTDDCVVNVKDALTVTATFGRPTLTVKVEPPDGKNKVWIKEPPNTNFDSPDGDYCYDECTVTTIDAGTLFLLKRAGGTWIGWEEDGPCLGRPNSDTCKFYLDGNTEVVAIFAD